MSRDNELIIRINGNIKGYKDALKAATKETEDLQTVLNQIAAGGAIVFAALGGAAILAIDKFAQFDHTIRGVKTLLDESSFSTKTLEQGFQDLSQGSLLAFGDFPLTLQGINKSLFDIVSASVPAADAISVLGSTSRLAVAGITDAATATDGVTTAMNSFGIEAENAELIAAKLFTAQKLGKTDVKKLSDFMGEAASTAHSFGVSFEELLAATVAATSAGIKTDQAFTSLNAILSNIAKPTKEASDEAERLGVEFNSTAIRTLGLTGFLEELTTAEGFNKESAEKLFGSTEALKVIYTLTGEQADKYKDTLDALSDSQQLLQTFQKAYEDQSKSLKNQLTLLANNVDVLGIIIGGNLAPNIEMVTGLFTDFLKLLHDNPALTDFISKMVLVGAVTATFTTIIGLGGLAILKYRAAMVAAGIATTGMTIATKVLIGSTGLGFLIAFLPEIVDLLENGLVKGLIVSALALYRLRAALIATELSAWNLALAVKSLVGSTGIGLLIVFLPEIIEALKKFFGDADDLASKSAMEQKEIALTRAQDEQEILQAKHKGLERQEIEFIRRSHVIKNKTLAALKIKDEETRKLALGNARMLADQLFKDKEKFNKEKKERLKKAALVAKGNAKKVVDEKLLGMQEENEQIRAILDGREKEEIAFLKRRQGIQKLSREAEAEKDANRRKAMLENVKLLKKQLAKEQEAADQKEMELLGEKGNRDAEREAKEIEESDRRIRRLQNEREIIKANQQKLTDDEISFIQRRQELEEEAIRIEEMESGKAQELAIANNKAKQDKLLEDKETFASDKRDLLAEQQEIDQALEEELRVLSEEQRAALRKKDIDELRDSLKTKADMKAASAKKELLARRKENQLFEKEEEKHGTTIATINAFFRSNEVSAAKVTSAQLISLQNDEVAAFKIIGKAAALVQIAISTHEGAMAAMSAFAKLPAPYGVAAGQVAAGVIIAAGARNAQKVAALQQGGIVPGTGTGDIVPAMLEPRELIVPGRNFEEVVNSVARERIIERETAASATSGGLPEEEGEWALRIDVDYKSEEAADLISVQENEQQYLGTSQRAFAR